MMHRFISPRSATEDGRRQEFILNIILLTSIVLLSLLDISLIVSRIHHGPTYDGIPFEALLIFITAFSALLFLSRKGYYIISSYLLVGIYLSLTLYGVLTWSFVLPMIILGAITTIVVTSILLGTRAAFLLTGFIAITTATITFLQIKDVIPVELYWKKDPLQVGDAIEISIIFFVIATLSWLSNREMELSLIRARTSEKLLEQERDALEERVEQRTKELKEVQSRQIEQLGRLAELGQLSSGIFHDLMNPLNAVIASIANAEHNPHMSDIKQSVIKAVAASRRMGSFLETARKQLRPAGVQEVFSAQRELIEAIDILTYKARCNDVVLQVNASRDIPLFGVALKFHQVALNLIANAIESYEAVESPTRAVTISLFKRGRFAVLKVTDHGCGIPEHVKGQIFEAFYTTKEKNGLGLGLATVKTVVEKEFHGTLEVTTNTDGGTSFSAFFPIHSHT
jgi:signal transduction histidine kinase